MKKILLGLSVFFATLISAQNYPDYYPNSNNNNGGYYSDYDDEYYFPDDYYYQYPSDYYTNDYYQSYYNDYQRSIYDINWNRFFRTYRLSPWQIDQIMMLNDMFPTFAAWDNYYRYNPDRWYYDRFYALERILGPRIFIVFQNNYYRGYNPVVYYQNYRRQHYATNIYVVPRYRNLNVNRYRIDRNEYHQNNPRQNFGFSDNIRNGANGTFNNSNTPRTGGFRDNGNLNQGGTRSGGFRDGSNQNSTGSDSSPKINNGGTRSGGFRGESTVPQSNGGFRNNESGTRENSIRNSAPERKIENNSGGQRNSSPGFRTQENSTRTPGMRLTSQ